MCRGAARVKKVFFPSRSFLFLVEPSQVVDICTFRNDVYTRYQKCLWCHAKNVMMKLVMELTKTRARPRLLTTANFSAQNYYGLTKKAQCIRIVPECVPPCSPLFFSWLLHSLLSVYMIDVYFFCRICYNNDGKKSSAYLP